jgi:putative transposase
MPRTARSLVAGGHYHVISRGNNRARLFEDACDYDAFLRLIGQAQRRHPLSLLAACVMPNHVHFVVAQQVAGDISRWMHWLLTTHAHRHHLGRETCGRVWQGRFKAFAVQQDVHLLTVMRYVERNPLRAGLVERAEDWAWGSLAWRHRGAGEELLAHPPLALPANWRAWVNSPQTSEELAALRASVNHQRPYGDELWSSSERERCGSQDAGRQRGRPRKVTHGQPPRKDADAGQQAFLQVTGQLTRQPA